MKRFTLLLLLAVMFLISCNSKTSKQSLLTVQNLKSVFITLNDDSAYNLKTPKGAIIKIARNSFIVKANEKIKLEIKEAYSASDILLAGLSTTSNGKPLKSGGMIYINATVDGKGIEPVKPIGVSIPSEMYDEKMQLFKGEITDDSTINWVDPEPLDTSLAAKKIIDGAALFKANCASCHKPTADFTGPALAGTRLRQPYPEWAYKFTRNPTLMRETDAYAKFIFRKWNSTMTAFSDLTKEEVDAILDYCDNEAKLNSWPNTATPAGMVDTTKNNKVSCGFDTVYTTPIDTTIEILPFIDTETDTLTYDIDVNRELKPEDIEGLRNGFTDPNITNGMYDFKIATMGWYNVDAFVEGYAGTTNVKINVQLQMQFESEMHVYLFCPRKKMLSVAYDHEGNTYRFDKNEGTVPLFLNDRAIILAFGSKGEKIFYGVATIDIKTEQTVKIEIKETTEEKLKQLIEHNNIDGIKIDLEKKEDFNIIEIPCDQLVDSTKTKVIALK